MTLKRYLYEPELTGTAHIVALGRDDKPWVRLDQTWFHPQGGGQKADRGTIAGVSVTHVAHAEDGQVNHYVEDIGDLSVGQEVEIAVDAQWRTESAALHTGGHLVAAAVETLFPGVKAVQGHHWPGEARVEFIGNALPNVEEVMSVLPPALEKAVLDCLPIRLVGDPLASRTIQIGIYAPLPCGGTHLTNTGQLHRVAVHSAKIKGGRLRISYGG